MGYRDSFVDGREGKPRNKKPTPIQPKNGSSSLKEHGDGSGTGLVQQVPEIRYHTGARLSPTLSMLPWKDDMLMSYLFQNLSAGFLSVVCQNLATPQPSLSISTQRHTVKQSLLALATILYAVNHSETSLLLDGRRRYGQALKMVTNTINSAKASQITETMASVYALSLLEVKTSVRKHTRCRLICLI